MAQQHASSALSTRVVEDRPPASCPPRLAPLPRRRLGHSLALCFLWVSGGGGCFCSPSSSVSITDWFAFSDARLWEHDISCEVACAAQYPQEIGLVSCAWEDAVYGDDRLLAPSDTGADTGAADTGPSDPRADVLLKCVRAPLGACS